MKTFFLYMLLSIAQVTDNAVTFYRLFFLQDRSGESYYQLQRAGERERGGGLEGGLGDREQGEKREREITEGSPRVSGSFSTCPGQATMGP